jgi:3-dehydroquinate synthase
VQVSERRIKTPTASYPIVVAAGALRGLPEQLAALDLRGALWLVVDAAVQQRYGARLELQLAAAGFTICSFVVPSGEASKDLATLAKLYDWMLSKNVERRDAVLALGGGVIGDLAGFAAATVLRGIALVQLPTTLLAMVDSAVGGKTGVNHERGKNLIGAFHQPRLVLSDSDTLASLPPRELCAGWAEVIKHGVIRDAGLFEWLERERSALAGWQLGDEHARALVADIIRRAVKVKVDIVNVDERETGERMLLNYGHTLGHAIEAAAGYGTLLHGEAVAIGMHLEAQIAQQLGMVEQSFVERQRALLAAYDLPTALPDALDMEQVAELILRDKKVSAGKVRWVLPCGLGSATVRDDVPAAVVQNILQAPV